MPQLYDKENQLHDHYGTFARVGAVHEQYGGYSTMGETRRLITIGDALRERIDAENDVPVFQPKRIVGQPVSGAFMGLLTDGLVGRRGRVAWDANGHITDGFGGSASTTERLNDSTDE